MENSTGRLAPPSAAEARATLDAVADDRHRVATRLRRNARWYAPTYGTLVGGVILATGAPTDAIAVLIPIGLVAFVALATTYWLRLGMWPRPGTPGQALAMVLVAIVTVTGMVAAWNAWHTWEIPALGIVVAVVVGAMAGALSWSFDNAAARAMEHP